MYFPSVEEDLRSEEHGDADDAEADADRDYSETGHGRSFSFLVTI